MSTFDSHNLLKGLQEDIQQMLAVANDIQYLPDAHLSRQPQAGKWSIAQVLGHLNSYNRYYLPEINKALQKGSKHKPNPLFKPGWFGNYFTKMMQPGKDGVVANKMQSPKDHRPAEKLNAKTVISEFINGQQKLLNYLQQAERTDMAKLKVPISISRFIKLKLGDTFRFLIAHQLRHFVQLKQVLAAIPGEKV